MNPLVVVFLAGIGSHFAEHASAIQGVGFGYKDGPTGPDEWGRLRPDYRLCSEGKRQSPINIVKDYAVYNPRLKPLNRKYVPSNATLVDNGFNIALIYDKDVGTVFVDGKNYSLLQMHWHSPSEHTIDGVRYAMELHLVHKSDDGNVTVIAILYQYGKPDPFLFQIKDKIDELAEEVRTGNEKAHVAVGLVDTKAFKRNTRKYFRYIGSFSTPPCTENVIWSVLGKVREISKEQAAALRKPLDVDYKYNSRPTQPLNGRRLELYDELRRKKSSG